jgi:hypothetical protein
MTNQRISPFGRLRRPAGLIRLNRSYTTTWDATLKAAIACCHLVSRTRQHLARGIPSPGCGYAYEIFLETTKPT